MSQTELVFKTKEDALEALEIARRDYLEEARAAALTLKHKRITIDDVRELCPPPESIDPRVMGAVFNTPDWEAVGYVRSKRTTCHKRPIAQFQYVGGLR